MASPKPVGTPMMRARFSWTGSWVVIIGVGVGDGKGVESREKLAVDWKASDICVSAPGHRSKMCKIVGLLWPAIILSAVIVFSVLCYKAIIIIPLFKSYTQL